MSKFIRIKCIECGKWKNIKIIGNNGAKRKKVCDQCLHPERYKEDLLV